MYRKTDPIRVGVRAGRAADCRLGATLIELLVVVSLMGMLIGMLIPSINRSMSIAASTVCKHNLREIGQAVMMYQMDYDGALPSQETVDAGPLNIRKSAPWFSELFPTYLSDPAILTCPKDPFGYRMRGVDSQISDPKVGDFSSYGINGFMVASAAGAGSKADRLRSSRPHNTILMADLGPDVMSKGPQLRGTVGPSRNGSMLRWDDGFDPFAAQPRSAPWVTKRHGHGINMMTLTGGVQEAKTQSVMKTPLRRFYADCAAGGCIFCKRLRLPHYSFAKDRLYWWTGSTPSN